MDPRRRSDWIFNKIPFPFRYVGLCASIKIVALVIFAADWYFVNRRKNLDKAKPITADEIVGSIISLDKLFEEKNLHEDDLVLKGVVHSDGGQKRLLVATRHSRNDSRGLVQLEMKYGSDGETAVPFKKSHIRSSSCDVKFMRDFDNLKVPKKCHSRTSSRDMEQEFRKRFSHNRNNNSDHLNIKCIINYLKSTPKNGMLNEELDGASSSAGGSGTTTSRRGHSRNHSYDRIYTAANNNEAFQPDYLDQQQLQHQLEREKDVNLRREWENQSAGGHANKFLEIVAPAAAAIELLVPASFESKYTHSRNNSKDFNVNKLDDFPTAGLSSSTAGNLRHRRTNSKDLNVVTAGAGGVASGSGHRRNSSHQRIQLEGEEQAEELGATATTTGGQSLMHFNNNINEGRKE